MKKKYNYQNWLDKSYDKELEKNIKTGRKKTKQLLCMTLTK